jgi:ATP-dependent DNA helicase RecG
LGVVALRSTLDAFEQVRILAGGAGETLAFFGPLPPRTRLAETCVAMANSRGGWIVLGAASASRIQGLEQPHQAVLLAREAGLTASPPLILPLPRIIEHDGSPICLIEIPPGLPHVYGVSGRYLVREGARNRDATPTELTDLLLQRDLFGFESRALPGAKMADLDPEAVRAYAGALGSLALASEDPAALTPDLTAVLLERGCASEESGSAAPTVAGLLLFAKRPARWIKGATLTLVRYAGESMSDEFLRQEATGGLPDQIRVAEAFVAANLRRGVRLGPQAPGRQGGAFERAELTEYPLAVVREAIVNAVSHRDYAIRGDAIRVMLFSDRMEVYSPGRLPGHVTLDNLVSERFSRNEVIVQALADLGFVERLGYGIDRMMVAMRQAGLPPPEFAETTAGFRVTLRNRGEALVSPETSPRWGNRRVNPRQERALAYVMEHGSITNREFRDLFPDLSDETIRRELADLVDAGLLIKVGERKATYYVLH